MSGHICCAAVSQTTLEKHRRDREGEGVVGGHESHMTRPFPHTVIPADLAVGAGSCCQNINKRNYMYDVIVLFRFSSFVRTE